MSKPQARALKVGQDRVTVQPLALGLMSMSGVYGSADENQCIATIHRAIDLGVNMLDTADMYGWGTTKSCSGGH